MPAGAVRLALHILCIRLGEGSYVFGPLFWPGRASHRASEPVLALQVGYRVVLYQDNMVALLNDLLQLLNLVL